MFSHTRLFILFAASSLLALGAGTCDSKNSPSGAGQVKSPTPTPEAVAELRETRSAPRVLYHGVHPGSANGDEESVNDLDAYLAEADKPVTFVYVSQELNAKWLDDTDDRTAFPAEVVRRIREHGAIPFIRLMTRKSDTTNEDINLEDLYTYDVVAVDPKVTLSPELEATKQKFRRRMLAWAQAAGDRPLFVEWGTEANGKWFWWNAYWHADERCRELMRKGRKLDAACQKQLMNGTEKFRLAFQGLRRLVNVEGKASNVKWAFHVTSGSDPKPKLKDASYDWNSIENYYPGEGCPECVDAIGVSVYGAQQRGDGCDDDNSFESQMNRLLKGDESAEHDSLKKIGKSKRIFVLEFGHTLISGKDGKPDPKCKPAEWACEALQAMFDRDKWPDFTIAGFSWWNESWIEADEKSVTDMRLHHFDLCSLVDEDEAKDVRKVLPCECWTGSGDADKCYALRTKRDDLRTTFRDTLDKYKDFLGTRPEDAFFK